MFFNRTQNVEIGEIVLDKLGYKIKRLRKANNMTQEELSCDILNRSSLCKIENELLIPSLPQLEHIASKLNISIIDLLLDANSNKISKDNNEELCMVESMYDNNKYFDIIEMKMPMCFETCFYKGMSYYNINLKQEAEKYLIKCKKLFNTLDEREKYFCVEKLCIALNSLRKIKITSFTNTTNLRYLKNILSILENYNCNKTEIYYYTISNIGAYYLFNKNYEAGINYIEGILKNNYKFAYTTVSAAIHLNLSIGYFSLRNYPEAIINIKKAIFFFNYSKEYGEVSECYINLFNYYLYSGLYNDCSLLIHFLYSNYENDKLSETFKVLELILLYNKGELEVLEEKSKKIKRSMLRSASTYDYYFLIARVNFFKGNKTIAEGYYNRCKKYLKENERYLDLFYLYKDMYNILENKNYLKKSEEFLQLYKTQKYNPVQPNITSPYYILRY